MNYERDVRIDEDALDQEWLEQSSLMLKFTKHAANVSRQLDEVNEELDSVFSELDIEIRSEPEKFNLPKITEAAITATIKLHKRYKEVFKRMLDVKLENNYAKGAVKSLENKKDALENLVKLYGQGYFAGPKMPKDITWERQQRQNRADESVGQRLKRKK